MAPADASAPVFTTANTLDVISNPVVQPYANYTVPFGYTVSQIRKGYGFGDLSNAGFTNRGDGQTIAIVLWNDTPTITTDLTKYSADMGLPAPTATSFQVVFADGTRPAAANQPTMTEADGDVETLHAIAPDANLVLVEAATDATSDVYAAVDTAAQIVANAGGGVVNMSFGVNEYSGVPALESHFAAANSDVSFIAATGDVGGALSFPATSPLVTSVGGTTLKLDSSGNRTSEVAWSSGGGGTSHYFSSPSFQNNVTINGSPIGSQRATPDVALAADPGTGANPTGLSLYHSWSDSNGNTGYDLEFAGTSLATPLLSGLVTMANQLRVADGNSLLGSGLNQAIYIIAAGNESTAFNDITSGNNTNQAYAGYDLATGWGSPKASSLIDLLAGGTATDQPPTIGSVTTSPGTQGLGVGFAFNASNVADPDGSVSGVSFYRESNSIPGLQTTGPNADALVGAGSQNGTTWSDTVSTAGLAAGTYTYYALATDNLGVTSPIGTNALSTTNIIAGAAPVLNAVTDSGISSTDGITNFNNSSPGKALQFTLSNTLPNATETLYINGTAYGSAMASGTTTVITTDGSTALPDGTYTVTFRQTPIFKSQSGDSSPMTLTILTAVPAAPAAPVLEAASDTGISETDGITSDATPTLDISATPYFRIYANGMQTGGSFQTGISCTLPTQADGTYTYTATAVDVAGNESAPSPGRNVTIDTTVPTITATRITPANANGWNNTSVAINYTASDTLSGLDSNSPAAGTFTFISEGANQSHTFTVTDIAGNIASASITAVNIDETAPTLTYGILPPPSATGWYNIATGAPTITFSAGDALSGLISTPAPVTVGEGANQTVTQTVTDLAGNSTTVNVTGLYVDLTAPAIIAQRDAAANANGWNNSSVSASFTAGDTGSGLASSASGSFVFSAEGANQSHTFTATDAAGNTASATISGVNIDETAPTLAASVNIAPAATGWYNIATGAPTITFSSGDALSGLVSTPAPVTVGEGANQTVTQTVTDLAGNSTTVNVTGLYVDLTAPAITAQRDTAANANGWNNTSVSASYTANDALAGLASPATGSFVFSSEGANQAHTFTVTDAAGNSASANITGVNIDQTAPTITASANIVPGVSGWYNIATGAPTITFAAGDSLSGGVTAPAPVVLGDGANQSISRTVTDLAGNSATVTISGLNIDLTPPAITAQRDTAANTNGWNNTSVSSSYTASDALSGLASAASGAFVFTTEGTNQSHTFMVTDIAGNSSSATINGINIDETTPTLSVNPNMPPAATGWYNAATGDPKFTFTDGDSLSGIVSTPAPVILGDGANQSVTGTVTDLAGNSSSATLSGIYVDLTAPVIIAKRDTAANANGWNNTSVSTSYTASDATSGLASPATGSFVFSSEGVNQAHTFTVIDSAGNTASATVSGIKIDETAPTLTQSTLPAPAATGWYNIATGAPTITYVAGDSLSGGVSSPAPVIVGQGTNQTISKTVTDLAGNSTTVSTTGLSVDLTPPSIVTQLAAPANANGWYNTTVVVNYTASDGGSGLAGDSPVAGTFTFSAEGANQSHTFTVSDVAGNSASAHVTGINIDLTPPVITATVDRAPASTGWYNSTTGAPSVIFTASDALSGGIPILDPRIVSDGANQTISATVTDLAGNSATATITGLNVDLTPPAITATRTTAANANGWNNTSVTLAYTASDATSGLSTPATGSFDLTAEGADQSHTFTITDIAGNTASATITGVNIDETLPTITATVSGPPAATGWYNQATGAPTITFIASDAISGGVTAPAAVTLADGANQTITRTVTDLAGNSATATITGLNVDTTPPVIIPSTGAPPDSNGDNDIGLTIGYQASDPISGLVSPATGSYTFITEGSNQSHTFTVTDVAGNTANATVGGINIQASNNERYVSQLYLDLLHRPIDATGLATWVTDLNNGATFQDVAMAITSSREYDGDVVNSYYETYLGRSAETYGLNAWVDQMQSGLNAEAIRAGILGSDEYYNDAGGTNAAFITALYQTFLGRPPENAPTGLPYWLGVLQTDVANGMTAGQAREAVSSAISNSNENRIDVVTSFYESFLHRAPDSAGLAAWVQNLANGVSQPTIITAFVTSPEYLSLNGIS